MLRLYTLGIIALVPVIAGAQPRGESEGTPGGGLTALYPWDQLGENVLQNGSFEETREDGQVAAWELAVKRSLELTEEDSNGGTKSLRMKDSHLARRYPAAIQTTELPPGRYELSGWVKTSAAGSNTKGAGARIEIRRRRGAPLAATRSVSGTSTWTRVKREFVFPGGPAEVRLAAYRKPDGELWFDDIELRPLVPPFVEGFLLYPNYRGLLFADAPQKIRLALDVRPELSNLRLEEVEIETRLVPEAGGPPAREDRFTPSAPHFEIELDTERLPAGAYLLELRAVRRDRPEVLARYPDHRIVKLTAAEQKEFRSFVDATNALVLDGERVFALGIYNTGGYSNSPGSYEREIRKIAEAPFDLYINYWLGRAPHRALAALTTALRRHGLSYLHTVNTWYETNRQWNRFPRCGGETPEQLGEATYVACRARELQSLDGFAGFYTADERPATHVERVFRQYRVLTSSARSGVTFIAQNQTREIDLWRDSADVFDLHQYPIFNVPEEERSPLEMVYERTRSAVSALEGSRPVVSVIQYFRHGSKGHFPTYDELRAMSFMAIAGGAKGLFYWSYGAKGLAWVKDPERKEELWQRLVKVTKEIKALEPLLLEEDAPDVLEEVSGSSSSSSSSASAIRVLCKKRGNEAYLIAVNLSHQSVAAHFRLSQNIVSISVEDEDRNIAPAAAKFSDSFDPHGVHIYRVTLSTAARSRE